MRTLDDIACLYGTDKSSLGHAYTATYDALLSPLRDTQCTVLEIGVWEGASIAMWRAYFEHAFIIGLDVDTSRAKDELIEGTHIRQGDAMDAVFIADVAREYGPFDVVIDDGAHMAHISQPIHALLWPHVAPRGLYFVEDLHTYWWQRANPAGAESWLLDIARDAMGRGVDRAGGQVAAGDVESVLFRQSLAAIKKRG